MIGIGRIVTRRLSVAQGTPRSSLIGYGLKEGWDVRFVSLSLRHDVDRNDKWCRQRCCAGVRTRHCHVLMVKTMVKVDPALLELHYSTVLRKPVNLFLP